MGDSIYMDKMRTDKSEIKDMEKKERPKKTYEQLETELSRVKRKSSARRKNIQGMLSTMLAYKNLNTSYYNELKSLRLENKELIKELHDIKNSKSYRLLKGFTGK